MRRGALFGALFAVLLAAAWWFLLISPRNASIDDARQELATSQDEESRLRGRIIQLEEIRDAEVEYLAGIGLLETLIPDRPRIEEFIEQVTALAEASAVELKSLSPSLPVPAGADSALRQIGVSVQIEGGFFEVLGFLFGLTDLERLVRVDGVAITASEVEGETVLAVSLNLQLFTLADLVPFPDGGDEIPGDGEVTPPDSPFDPDEDPGDLPDDTAPEV